MTASPLAAPATRSVPRLARRADARSRRWRWLAPTMLVVVLALVVVSVLFGDNFRIAPGDLVADGVLGGEEFVEQPVGAPEIRHCARQRDADGNQCTKYLLQDIAHQPAPPLALRDFVRLGPGTLAPGPHAKLDQLI